MGCFAIFVVVLCAVLSSDVIFARHPENAGGENYIVGGEEANITNYGYTAYLLFSNGTDNFECGSSIISRRYVLTAAHCFIDGLTSINARIGSSDKFAGGTTYDADYYRIHPRYNSSNFDYDAALVHFPTLLDLDGTNARRIRLVNGGRNVPAGTITNVTGWGLTEEGGSVSPRMLRVVQVPTLSNADCSTKLNNVTPRMLCAGLDEGGKDSCQGDSGGPMVRNNRQIGIVSNGVGCARPNRPGVYTNITNIEIRMWIRRNAGV